MAVWVTQVPPEDLITADTRQQDLNTVLGGRLRYCVMTKGRRIGNRLVHDADKVREKHDEAFNRKLYFMNDHTK